jgi:beta-glucanase (GH16 family)
VARINLSSGYGMWPAFWFYGDDWPTDVEINVLEARGNEPFQFQITFWPSTQCKLGPGRSRRHDFVYAQNGCQWRWLPMAALFSGEPLTWQRVYYCFHAWSKQGA